VPTTQTSVTHSNASFNKASLENAHFYQYPIDRQSVTEEIVAGLHQRQKMLHPKFFYDATGAELFDAITRLPAYYLSRAEHEILQRHCVDIVRHIGPQSVLIEPGCGTCDKVEPLLPSLRPRIYVPIDIAEDCLQSATQLPPGKRVAFYPGSSIGNYEPEAAQQFLRRIRELVGRDGGLLIGVDLQKNIWQLNAAYNDSQGITAAFNRNILLNVNRLTGSNFLPDRFDHMAFYDVRQKRIEMHLRSRQTQRIKIGDELLTFATGETIHTENSYKYTTESFCALAATAGFYHEQTWYDEKNLFSVHYFSAAMPS
jgi:uncharacterized SAM-dependent methyltransferase